LSDHSHHSSHHTNRSEPHNNTNRVQSQEAARSLGRIPYNTESMNDRENDCEVNRFDTARKMMIEYASQFEGVDVISTEDIITAIEGNQKVWLVDTRDAEEQRISMIPNALTQTQFDEAVSSGAVLKTDAVIPYCTMGYRSGKYAADLKKQGYSNVRNGEGVVLWTYGSKALVSKDSDGKEIPVNRVHTYGAQWDLGAPTYQSYQFSTWDMIFKGIQSFFGF
jgi:rhodanese-related sulfurtransferase